MAIDIEKKNKISMFLVLLIVFCILAIILGALEFNGLAILMGFLASVSFFAIVGLSFES